MKKLMMILCTILCANILAAQTFRSGGLKYEVISWYYGVRVTQQNSSAISGSVVIPSTVTYIGTTYNVTSIGDSAFYGCSGLTSVTIPNSVTSIGKNAFYGCRRLTSITIPNAVTSIGKRAFEGCSSLTTLNFNAINCQNFEADFDYHDGNYYSTFSGTALTTINIGDSVQRIPARFVIDCRSLTSVTIPNSVTSIGGDAFEGCSGLTSVTIPNSVTYIGPSAFAYCSGLTSVTISNSVTYIPDFVFKGCSGLTSVTIPYRVTYIGENAFEGCSGLTLVTIPNSVTSIRQCAFSGCSGLTSVRLPYSVTSIGSSAFYGCSGLTSVTIPNSVTYIGRWAFENCSGLTSVTIPNSVTSIGESAFRNCTGLTSVTIPNSVTSIGGFTFNGCSGLTSVTIPNSVTSIGGSTFNGCSGLTSVTIGNRVTSIGDRAFYECLNLSSLISSATVPPTIGNEAFPYPNICTVTVPCGSLEAYTASTCHWSVYFPQRITTGFPFELNASANDSTLGTVAITTGESCAEGVLTAIPELCYRFVAWSDGNTTNPRTITLTQDTTLTANFERAVYTQEIHHAICEGSVYSENGFNVSEAGTYTQTLQTVNGCDSIVTLNLTVNPFENTNTNLTAEICESSTYTENGFNLSEPGTYTQNLQTINGCDSIVTLTLTVNPTYNITIDASINEGETYEENGFSESEAGTYVHTLQSEFGCDSVITLNLTVNSSLNDVVANAIEVSLYPNPANAYTILKVEGLKEQTPVYLFDIQGRKLKEYVLNAAQQTLRIDLGDLPKGVYTIMLGNAAKKLIVE